MPAFTYRTMLIPEQGPPNNGLRYGSGKEANRLNTPFHPDLPVDRSVGAVAETLRNLPGSLRSSHPLLSFTGMNAQPFLDAQNLQEPLGPLRLLHEQAGWVILLGVDHTANTSIHLAERLAGRKEFIRWAALPSKVVECYNIPGCADGFLKAASLLEPVTRSVPLGNTWLQALPLKEMIPLLVVRIKRDHLRYYATGPIVSGAKPSAPLSDTGQAGIKGRPCYFQIPLNKFTTWDRIAIS